MNSNNDIINYILSSQKDKEDIDIVKKSSLKYHKSAYSDGYIAPNYIDNDTFLKKSIITHGKAKTSYIPNILSDNIELSLKVQKNVCVENDIIFSNKTQRSKHENGQWNRVEMLSSVHKLNNETQKCYKSKKNKILGKPSRDSKFVMKNNF